MNRPYALALLLALPMVALVGCTTGGGPGGNVTDMLNVPAGLTRTVDTPELTVNGNATVDGTLTASAGRLLLRVGGDLTVNGTVNAVAAASAPVETSAFSAQTSGVCIVTQGHVTFGDGSVLRTNGPVLITDSEDALSTTPGDAYDEVENIQDDLPTLVPLPPDNPAFAQAASVAGAVPQAHAEQAVPDVLTGTWDCSGFPGDRPVVVARFSGAGGVVLRRWTLISPAAPPGADDDKSTNPDDAEHSATGANGKNGMRLNIRNDAGPVSIDGDVVINLADGGDGGSAAAACADATGGIGGTSGNMRITGAGGVDLTNGTLTINPGRGGNGGAATATGLKAATACPGAPGCDVTATGGKGGDNLKRLFARGNVEGLENVIIGALRAGHGGDGTATAGEGGDGEECCDGGPGGDATAVGGAGGSSSLNVGTLPVQTGDVIGGDGGAATATGGNGGKGGDCKLDPGGNGGAGGDGTATGGNGGSGSGTPGATSGSGGDATANGGDGGAGGDSAVQPGAGGAGGGATGTAGAAGSQGTGGTPGTTNANPGNDGPAGGNIVPTALFCFWFDFIPQDGQIPAGTVLSAPLYDPDHTTQLGSIPLLLRDVPGAQYFKQSNPVNHVGWGPGEGDLQISNAQLGTGTVGDVVGVRIQTLAEVNIDQTRPLVVQGLDANGEVLDQMQITQVTPDQSDPHLGQPFDVLLQAHGGTIATIRIIVENGGFCTFYGIWILDP